MQRTYSMIALRAGVVGLSAPVAKWNKPSKKPDPWSG